MKSKCEVCFHHCVLDEGQTGYCLARENIRGRIVAKNYGKLTSLALDPIEKKPLYHFFPGSLVLSVGSYGCNLKCPFCQNVEISLADMSNGNLLPSTEYFSPEDLAELCKEYEPRGNIGIAFTYNEPLVGYEFVRDTARLVHEKGMKAILVTNGSAALSVLDEVASDMDAMNIDLKSFREEYYTHTLKGNLNAVKSFIEHAVRHSHVEVTTLIIPGENDSEDEMRELAAWLAETGQNAGREIPLHVSRFFPRSRYSNRTPTKISQIYRLAEVAREYLTYVYTGNC